jgi:Methionine biosynthesis protein MetW
VTELDDDHFRFRPCLDFLDALGVMVEPGSTWLDLGCSQGHFLRLLMKRHAVRAVPLRSSLGRGGLRTWLADSFPSLCSSVIAVAQKP